ncbi:MAG: PAS domain-containing protein [bacterium]
MISYFGKGGRGGGQDGGWGGGSDDGAAVKRFAMLAEVRAYWEGLRDGGNLPQRDQIDPRGIAGALENTFLLERVAPGIGRFRLAGMQLHDLMGMDVRGMPLTALIEPGDRNRITEQLEAVFAGPGIVELALEAERGLGRPALEGRLLILPLIGSRGATDLALGCLALHGPLGRAPRRFAIAGVTCEKIERRTSQRRNALRNDDDRRVPLPGAAFTGLADPAQPFATAPPRPPRGRPNLRLVHSRD